MDCDQAHNLFDAYLDGELSPALATELGAHRLGCPSCRQELALMEVAGHVVGAGADDPVLEDDFTDRLLACIEPTVTAPRKRRHRIIRIGVALAAAACVTLLVTILTRPGQQVASIRESADGAGPAIRSQEPTIAEAVAPELAEAIQSIPDTVLKTRESSTSLLRYGHMTLLEMIDRLRLEVLRDVGTQGASPEEEAVGEDADDVEDI
jgi:anti-sigma factor RsiW